MNQTLNISGSCLCKKVTVNASQVTPHIDACHCQTCRTWSGSAMLAIDCGTAVEFSGQDHISVYDSSDWADRGFCKLCGTHLFYRLKQNQQYIMPVGLFDTQQPLAFKTEIFIEEKPNYYQFANDTKKMTGEQVFAAFTQDK